MAWAGDECSPEFINTTSGSVVPKRQAKCAVHCFRPARKLLILNGEMLERSIRHAWKLIPVALTSG